MKKQRYSKWRLYERREGSVRDSLQRLLSAHGCCRIDLLRESVLIFFMEIG